MAFGRVKLKILQRVNHWLCKLKASKQFFISKGLYNCFAFIVEKLTPARVFELLSERDYTRLFKSTEIFRKSGRVGYYANDVVFGSDNVQQLNERCLPDLVVTKHLDVCLFHGSDHFVNLKARLLVNDYLANNDNPNNSYEDRVTYSQENRVLLLKRNKSHKRIKAGIMINGKFSYNYYHNMYENLIQLLVIEEINHFLPSDVPILVDEDVFMVPSFKRIFEILSNNLHREVLLTKTGEMVEARTLYHISAVNVIVPCHRDISISKDSDYTFDKDYTIRLREKLIKNKAGGVFPKRFLITRKNTRHRHFNEDEVFSILEPYGFEKVAPEAMTFEQQITLFSQAEWVIGGSGAAFTNMLFCDPGCHVVLIKNSPYLPPIFTPIVCINGGDIVFFTSSKNNDSNNAHSGFTVDVEAFRDLVEHYIAPAIVVD